MVVFYVALSLSNLGSLLESASWVKPLEIARLVTLILVAMMLLFAFPRFDVRVVVGVGVFGMASLLWFLRLP